MAEPLAPGQTIGILGGGQLGRMLAMAAARLGFRVHIFDPDAQAPAAEVAAEHTAAAYDDTVALNTFAAAVDLITFEFENIPLATVETLARQRPVRPGARALELSQDRLTEKDFLTGLGLRTAPYRDITSAADLAAALNEIGPGILKTRRFGYDGKGQVRLAPGDDTAAALAEVGNAPAILEGLVPFTCEISVIGARGLDGAVTCYDPGQNVHRDGILHTTTVPADVPAGQIQDAVLLTGQILNALDYTGVLGVELFVTPSGLLVNEIAPRVHNSGHWTEAACQIDQFEQHIRAIAGWPMGDGSRHSNAVMTNLIGDEIAGLPTLDGTVHHYGKREARPGRKMGHVTRISPRS